MERRKLEKPILAEGEVTGHAHCLVSPNVDVFETESETREFDLSLETELVHEEHGTITLSPGQFESDQVVEYDPYLVEARKVRD